MSVVRVMEFSGIGAELTGMTGYDAALNASLQAKSDATTRGDLRQAAHASKAAGECFRRLGEFESATVQYDYALRCFEELNDVSGQAWTLWAKANLLRHFCEYVPAIRVLARAHRLAIHCGDATCEA